MFKKFELKKKFKDNVEDYEGGLSDSKQKDKKNMSSKQRKNVVNLLQVQDDRNNKETPKAQKTAFR